MSISAQEYLRRYQGLRDLMEQENLDCILVAGRGDDFNRGHIRYVTGSGNGGYCILSRQGRPVFLVRPYQLDSPKLPTIIEALELLELRGTLSPEQQIVEELRRCHAGNKIGIVGMACIPVSVYQAVEEAFPAGIVDAEGIFHRMRIIKSSEEIDHQRKAAAIADEVYGLLREMIRPGLSEYEIYGAAKRLIYAKGCGYSFELIDAAGSTMNMSFVPTKDELTSPGTLFFEITPAFQGYYAQLPVTLPVGSYPPHIYKMVEAWHRSDQAAQALLRPGTRVSDLYTTLINSVENSGFISPLEAGHDLGLDAHESITVEAVSPVVLQPGMVLAIHACVMEKVAGDGVGMGYTYLITEDGAERFSRINLAEELL